MKKTLFPFAFAVFALLATFSSKVSAQITGITVNDIDSTLSNGCQIPFLQYLNIYGNVQGTPPANDLVTMDINFGDGVDSTFTVSDQQGYFDAYVQHNYQIAGSFVAAITVTSSNGMTASATSQTFIVTNNCASISGQVYVDLNSNCTYDAGSDATLGGVPLLVTNTTTGDSTYTWADTGGHYAINMPNGYSYTVKPLLGTAGYYPTDLTASCPASGITTVALSGSTQEADFGYTCSSSTSIDMFAGGWAESYRPGYNRTIGIEAAAGWYYYYLCSGVSATVTLTLDSRLTYTGTLAGPAPTTISGNTLTWNFAAANSYTELFSEINVMCDPSANIGDTICNTVAITSSTPDPDPSNNTLIFCAPINNSMDPNFKEVAPQGTGLSGLIPNNTPLSYLINFQNTGTDVAYNVTVTDTLNANVDINSVKINRSSAPVQVYTLPGNVLNFRFNNINLPDSTANAAGSHGFISYSVVPKSNLAAGMQITNTAHIYFDFNKAVNTNTTLNTIEGPTGIQQLVNGSTKVSVYPNPADEQVSIKTDNGTAFTVSVLDMLGRSVNNGQSGNGNIVINTQSLSSGLYLVKITTANGKEFTTKLNVQH